MTDVETLLAKVWNPTTRSHAEEAWRCYNAGAIRASITATWTAITADIIAKIGRLADDSDGEAKSIQSAVEHAQAQGLSTEGVRSMQTIENQLLDNAVQLELLDPIDKRALERIREDRNLCVHPSLRPFNEVFAPQPEAARAHLAIALDVLLIQGPTQGRKIVESYIEFTCSPAFVPSTAHIQATYLDRVRPATRRNLAAMAAKHALLELNPADRMDPTSYADRSATVLKAFAARERELVRGELTLLRDRFREATPECQRRALGRLGDLDLFWDMTDGSLVEHLNNLVGQEFRVFGSEPLKIRTATTLSLVAVASVRDRLGQLETQFNRLSSHQKVNVIEARPDPYFVPAIINLLADAGSYRFGETVGQLLVEHAAFLTMDDLGSALQAWASNDQCWRAGLMPEAAVNLLGDTRHLGRERVGAFTTFLDAVRQQVDADEKYYNYPELAAALDNLSEGPIP